MYVCVRLCLVVKEHFIARRSAGLRWYKGWRLQKWHLYVLSKVVNFYPSCNSDLDISCTCHPAVNYELALSSCVQLSSPSVLWHCWLDSTKGIRPRRMSLSLRFNSHFPGGPRLSGTSISPIWILLELSMMEVVVTTGAINRAKLQSNHDHQQTNTQFFTGRMSFLLPN